MSMTYRVTWLDGNNKETRGQIEKGYCLGAVKSLRWHISSLDYWFLKERDKEGCRACSMEERVAWSRLVREAFNLDEFIDDNEGRITFNGEWWSFVDITFVTQLLRAPTETWSTYKNFVRSGLSLAREFPEEDKAWIIFVAWLIDPNRIMNGSTSSGHSPFPSPDLVGVPAASIYKRFTRRLRSKGAGFDHPVFGYTGGERGDRRWNGPPMAVFEDKTASLFGATCGMDIRLLSAFENDVNPFRITSFRTALFRETSKPLDEDQILNLFHFVKQPKDLAKRMINKEEAHAQLFSSGR